MKEYFEEFAKKSQKPAFSIADLKRAVRSENMPHNKLNPRGAELQCAEDVYIGMKLLCRLHPEEAVDDMARSALFPLRAEILESIKVRQQERRASEEPTLYKEANELEAAFDTAIDRALDRLMAKARTR